MNISIVRDELARTPGVSAWLIREKQVESQELFFIRQELDMNRAKTVRHLRLTVYHDYRAEGRDWRGSAGVRLHPSSGRREIKAAIAKALQAAALVRNRPHPLARPAEVSAEQPGAAPAAAPAAGELAGRLEAVRRAVFSEDRHEEGRLNSCEIFLDREHIRVLNSEGVDVRFERGRSSIELIAEWQARGREEVETYRELRFAGVDEGAIKAQVRELLQYTRDRAHAQPLGGSQLTAARTVLLSGEAVPELIGYYLAQSAAENVYRRISSLEVGRSVQGRPRGDSLTVRLSPFLEGSSASAPYDADGHPLREVTLIEEGVLCRYWGPVRFCHYLDCPPTGRVPNLVVTPGTRGAEEMRREPYLEVVSFSDFQCDPLTGDFGGEIRLAYLGNGKEAVPVTGGSISGNLRRVQEGMTLSAELASRDNFRGPRTLGLRGVAVTPAGD
jgi:predicted Zn-dependent protease